MCLGYNQVCRWTGTGGTASPPQQPPRTCGKQAGRLEPAQGWDGQAWGGSTARPSSGSRMGRVGEGTPGLLRPLRAGQAMGSLQIFIQKSHRIGAVLQKESKWVNGDPKQHGGDCSGMSTSRKDLETWRPT